MRLGLDGLIDDVADAYCEWREESAAVESAYRRWAKGPAAAAHAAFVAYVDALDREQCAAEDYAQILSYASGRARDWRLAEWLEREG
jgi:hypothetical protein